MSTCGDREGWGPITSRDRWDFTPCFEEGILLSTLLVGLFVCIVFRAWTLRYTEPRVRSSRSRRLLQVKLVVLVLAFLGTVANAVLAFMTRTPLPVSYLLEAIVFSAVPYLTYINHTRTRTSSNILLIFWPLYCASIVAWARTRWLLGVDEMLRVIFSLRCSVTGLGLLAFIVECLGPETLDDLRKHSDTGSPESPFVIANVYERWMFQWMTPILQKGAKQTLTEEDLPELLSRDQSSPLGKKLEQSLRKHKALWKALFAAYGGPFVLAAFLKLCQDALAFLQPQLLRQLLVFISDYQRARSSDEELPNAFQGFAIAVIMFLASLAQTFILHQYFQLCFEVGLRVRAGLVTIIYNKALALSSGERSRSSGDVVNLQSVDASRLQEICTYGLIGISGPFQIILAFISLYRLLGWPAFVGVAIMVFSIPLNAVVARFLKRMQEAQMKNRDERTRLMSELLNNIRSIKLHAWENAFIRRILVVRNDKELRMLRKIGITTAFNSALWTGIPLLVAFSSFALAALVSSEPLTSDVIFPAISLFMLLQFPLAMFPQVISGLVESSVSVKRISDFFSASEVQPDARQLIQKPLALGDVVLEIQGGEFCWSENARNPTLEGIDLTVRKGELVGIWGRVGSGKSSLLSAVCGDMIRVEGKVNVYGGSIAYAPQNPWIMSATIRDNIIFSHEFDQKFYDLVLDACCLRPDLTLLDKGDMTIVGEKGITLSGGQRARVSLARAVYARADLTLLDDTLAALDSQVAASVMEHVIGHDGLLGTKARILVTHSISAIREFDTVAYLRRGVLLECGTPSELLSRADGELAKLVRGHTHTPSRRSSGSTTPVGDGDAATLAISESSLPDRTSGQFDELVKVKLPMDRRKSFGMAALANTLPIRAPAELSKEHKEQGRVKPEVYLEYIRSCSRTGFIFFLLTTVLSQAMVVFSNLTLRAWGEHNSDSGSNDNLAKYLTAYGLFSLSSTILGAVSSLLIWVTCSMRSAKYLHDNMLHAVLRAPLSFFEQTPTGRTLNLFSRDVYVIDSVLGRVIQGLTRTLCMTLGIIAIIGGALPPFLIAVVPLGWFYWRVMQYYLGSSRELKRFDSVSRSPIFAWFSESLAGMATIRAFNQQQVFQRNNNRRIDTNSQAYLPSVSVNRWLAVRLEFVGAGIILVASTLSLVTLVTSGVDAGLVGLVISYALNTTSSLNWVVRMAGELEQNATSVERILHQTNIKSEAPAEIPDMDPHGEWPSAGAIEFRNYSMRYRPELDTVLKGITFDVKPGEKVGIVGRTGSGKSSLLLSLFRVIEAAGGSIYIDGIDSSTIGLSKLRSSISIVPQSPELFEGTMRQNIDPLEEFQDADIWNALAQTHLKDFVEALPGGLDAPVTEGGGSMSAGQRQLLCFARALLRRTKILVLDEATSAVDLDTDRSIQDIIKHIPGVTLLTIAHRINTIMDYDRILVLDAGKVVEYDSPANLLESKTSMFTSLAVSSGLA